MPYYRDAVSPVVRERDSRSVRRPRRKPLMVRFAGETLSAVSVGANEEDVAVVAGPGLTCNLAGIGRPRWFEFVGWIGGDLFGLAVRQAEAVDVLVTGHVRVECEPAAVRRDRHTFDDLSAGGQRDRLPDRDRWSIWRESTRGWRSVSVLWRAVVRCATASPCALSPAVRRSGSPAGWPAAVTAIAKMSRVPGAFETNSRWQLSWSTSDSYNVPPDGTAIGVPPADVRSVRAGAV